MVFTTIVTGAYKAIYNWGASHCIKPLDPPGGIGLESHESDESDPGSGGAETLGGAA